MIGLSLGVQSMPALAYVPPVVVPVGPVISGTFVEIGDTYDLVTTAVSDGNWHWARTDVGVTLTADGSGGWSGGVVLASGTQAVGADSASTDFDAGGADSTLYMMHVYQRTAAGVDSNVISTTYTKDAAAGAIAAIVGTPTNTTASGVNNVALALPTTRTIGNWQYIIAGFDDDKELFEPTGFTALTANRFGSAGVLSIRAFAREITAGNAADTTATLFADGFGVINAVVFETTGSGSGVAVDSATVNGQTTHPAPSVTTTVDNSLIFEAMVARQSGTGTADYAYTASNALLMVNTQEQATAGATTPTSFVTPASTSTWSPTLAFSVSP